MPGRNLPAPITEPSPVLDPDAVRVPTSHQLAPHRTQTGRIADHLAAISADLRAWTELRIELVQRKVEGIVGIVERVQHYADAAKYFAPALVLLVIGLVFVFVTLALGIGALVGSAWLGFLIVTVLLLGVAGTLAYVGMRKVKEMQALVLEAKKAEKSHKAPSRAEVQEAERLTATQSAV